MLGGLPTQVLAYPAPRFSPGILEDRCRDPPPFSRACPVFMDASGLRISGRDVGWYWYPRECLVHNPQCRDTSSLGCGGPSAHVVIPDQTTPRDSA